MWYSSYYIVEKYYIAKQIHLVTFKMQYFYLATLCESLKLPRVQSFHQLLYPPHGSLSNCDHGLQRDGDRHHAYHGLSRGSSSLWSWSPWWSTSQWSRSPWWSWSCCLWLPCRSEEPDLIVNRYYNLCVLPKNFIVYFSVLTWFTQTLTKLFSFDVLHHLLYL